VFLGLFYWLARRAESLYNLLVFPYSPTLLFPPHATCCIYSQYIRSSHSPRPRALPGALSTVHRPCPVTYSGLRYPTRVKVSRPPGK